MTASGLAQKISKTGEKYKDKTVVAFLGQVSSGKTVVAALLKHALVTTWIPGTRGKWEAVVSSGQDRINDIIRRMKDGEFAPPTPKENHPRMVMDIYRMNGHPAGFKLQLHDMSGENHASLLTDPKYKTVQERLNDILDKADYIAHATKYVIMISCEDKDKWDTNVAKVTPMITQIKEMKQIIHNYGPSERMHAPIAVVFTKADLLPGNDISKSAEELARHYPELLSSLNVDHDGNSLKFLKVHVSTTEETDEEFNAEMERIRSDQLRERKRQHAAWIEQTRPDIDQRASDTRNRAESEGLSRVETDRMVHDVIMDARKSYDEQFDLEHPIHDMPEDRRKIRKVNMPLDYSESAYLDLISWILDR